MAFDIEDVTVTAGGSDGLSNIVPSLDYEDSGFDTAGSATNVPVASWLTSIPLDIGQEISSFFNTSAPSIATEGGSSPSVESQPGFFDAIGHDIESAFGSLAASWSQWAAYQYSPEGQGKTPPPTDTGAEPPVDDTSTPMWVWVAGAGALVIGLVIAVKLVRHK